MGYWIRLLSLLALFASGVAAASPDHQYIRQFNFDSVRAAIDDMRERFGDRYPGGESWLTRLNELESRAAVSPGSISDDQAKTLAASLRALKRDALLANPLLDIEGLLLVKRRNPVRGVIRPSHNFNKLGIPSNHECNASLAKSGYDNEIAMLSPLSPEGELKTLYRPDDNGYVGMVDLHWDADRLLVTKSDAESWKIWELGLAGAAPRQVSRMAGDVDAMDAIYLPDGGILFGSTASFQSVPCWHGIRHVSNLYLMNEQGGDVRQLCFDQDHDYHPSVLDNGQILYTRWDYTGINHIYQRQLMVMNPDGTGQRAVYGTNSWFPNSLFFARQRPGHPNEYLAVLSGYHGVHKMGQLVMVDAKQGWQHEHGLIKRISGEGEPIDPEIKDALVDGDWPKFLHPYPLDDTYFLVSAWVEKTEDWAIYLADAFDNLTLLYRDPDYALFEPVPVMKRPVPPVIPPQVDESNDEGVVYLHDVYAGPGLDGVPRGVVRSLRVIAYNFGYRHLAGPHKIGYGGPWEAMAVIGTVPLESDGSAMFHAPANMPLALQALDGEGKAVQLMRSWFTLMPGETRSCVGCHEGPNQPPAPAPALAALREPRAIEPSHGLPRGFDFEREVQPVLDAHCVACHNGERDDIPDLRAERFIPDYEGLMLSSLGADRLHPDMKAATGGLMKYTPAYDGLLPYIRRVAIEDDVSLLVPGEYHADSSELIQMLNAGHHGVSLDREALRRLSLWIDLNGPCHGTWSDAYPVPEGSVERRRENQALYGRPGIDLERMVHPVPYRPECDPDSNASSNALAVMAKPWSGQVEARTLDLGDGVTLELAKIPAGSYNLVDEQGEHVQTVELNESFWMGRAEVTNEQFRRFDPEFDNRYYAKRHARSDDMGLPLNGPDQPAVRVSYEDAKAFCQWLSGRSGLNIALPRAEQWQYAYAAGGAMNEANMAGAEFSRGHAKNGLQVTGGVEHLAMEGAALSDRSFDDGHIVTAPAGAFPPNAFGLYDLRGNAAEWTQPLDDRSKPYARGGSFFDRPERCSAGAAIPYPAWRRIFNVGFRVVAE